MNLFKYPILFVFIILIFSMPISGGINFSNEIDLAIQWLSEMQDATGSDNGMIDSFEDYWEDGSPVTKAYTYDQAVGAIAFMLVGEMDRAKKVLDRLKTLQGDDGSWCNSYWYNNYYGEELRLHVGPAMWVAMAVLNYEKITNDLTTYHDMAIKTIDWSLTFQKANGAISGGRTTWDDTPNWTDEVWSSTEHNIDVYPVLQYFATTTPSKSTTYLEAATKVKEFLDNVVWDNENRRFLGGFKNNTGLVDQAIPMDVNPWGVLGLGLTGTHNYQASLDYVENANGNPGTLENPCYKYTLPYGNETITAYDFDWESTNNEATGAQSGGGLKGPDIWFEGSFFMSCAYQMRGDSTKAEEIISELIKKQGKDGSMEGGFPYCLNGTNNNYWAMAQTNCVSSTGWMVIAAKKWNPFTGVSLKDFSTVNTQEIYNNTVSNIRSTLINNTISFNRPLAKGSSIELHNSRGQLFLKDIVNHNFVKINSVLPKGLYLINIMESGKELQLNY